jgi:uncharacterized RDD family membrane protein YckC
VPPEHGKLSLETVLALDNVPLELPVAGVGLRVLSGFVDYLLVTLLLIGWLLAWFGLAFSATAFRASGLRMGFGWLLAVMILGIFAIEYGYFAGLELWLGGRTVGKWALGLRVVNAEGGRPGPAALLMRNAVRFPDLIVGVPLMALDPLARRLGDRLARTLVVHARSHERELVLGRLPKGWGGREVAVAESFLRRANDLEPRRAELLARQLLGLIERDDPSLLLGSRAEEDAVETLRRVLEVRV